MHILYLAAREYGYPRNDVVLRALRRLGTVEIVSQPRLRSLLVRSAIVFWRALPSLLTRNYDLVLVGFYGHLLMLPIGLLKRSPILFDAFVSTYDTLCFDRQIFAPHSVPGRLAFWLDQISCRLASRVLVDTPSQADYFSRTFGLDIARIHSLPVGCNEDLFCPQLLAPADDYALILYYSTYQPLHGMETVIRAAAQLNSEPHLRFKLIGTGPDYAQMRILADQLHVQNISFLDFVPLANLPKELAAATICLGGPFGLSGKASRVIPGKIYQILAMGRPLLAADTPANQQLLTHEETAYLCPPADPDALATAILKLHHDVPLRERLAACGRTLYLEQCSEATITERLRRLVFEMTEKPL